MDSTAAQLAPEAPVPLPNTASIHTFPAFVLSLCTALEADPASVSQHLSNLQTTHGVPATISGNPGGEAEETDHIVASLLRIAARLTKSSAADSSSALGPSPTSTTVKEEASPRQVIRDSAQVNGGQSADVMGNEEGLTRTSHSMKGDMSKETRSRREDQSKDNRDSVLCQLAAENERMQGRLLELEDENARLHIDVENLTRQGRYV